MMKSNEKKKKSEKFNDKNPRHIAIIMDGNGRWAQNLGLPRIEGHRASRKSIRETVEGAIEFHIPYLSLFAFSTENWSRPKSEILAIFRIFTQVLKEETPELNEKGVQIIFSGDLEKFPKSLQNELNRSIQLTKYNQNLVLNICLDYSGKKDILQVIKKILTNADKVQEINEELVEKYLLTYPLPSVDLLIRTSGEQRISNFMLWQAAYAEFYFSKLFWPDFTKQELLKAITEFQKRDRRFGGIS